MKPESVIHINPKILGGTPALKGTRVPIETLFDHLESGIYMEDFLTDFPSVTKEQVFTLIALVGKVLSKEILYSPR